MSRGELLPRGGGGLGQHALVNEQDVSPGDGLVVAILLARRGCEPPQARGDSIECYAQTVLPQVEPRQTDVLAVRKSAGRWSRSFECSDQLRVAHGLGFPFTRAPRTSISPWLADASRSRW